MDNIERSESEVNFLKIRDRTKSVGDTPRHLFLPFSSRFQVSSSFKFHVFLLLETFLNVCFFTLLTPFRFVRNSKRGYYIIQSNLAQEILSTFVFAIATIYAILDLRYFLEQNLKESPHKAFGYAYGLIKGCIPVFWMVTFWLQRKWFSKLLTVCQGKISHPLFSSQHPPSNTITPSRKLRYAVNFFVGLTVVKVVFELIYGYEGIDQLLTYNAGTALYNLHLKGDYKQIDPDELWKSPFCIALGLLTTAISLLLNYIEYMFDLFCFIGAAMVYAVCDHFSDQMEKLSRISSSTDENVQSKRILKLMQTNYIDLVAILDSINEVFGSLIVLYFLGSYPTLVWSVFGIFRKVSLSYGIFYMHKICIFILVTVTAAEGNSKVQEFKQWLFHTSIQSSCEESSCSRSRSELDRVDTSTDSIDLSSLNILHREVSTETLGLKGYKFFTVTHELLGTMIGIVVTYAIVMLQFEMDADDGTRSPMDSKTTSLSFAKDIVYNVSATVDGDLDET